MAINIITATFTGIEGVLVNVEVDISRGLPCFNIVGLANTSVKESKERVRSAIINSGFDFPVSRITINLAPADIRKDGSSFDLPIAIGILLATGQIKFSKISQYLFFGELSLSGDLKKVKGALPIVVEASNSGIKNFIVPFLNCNECSMVKGINIYPFKNLKQITEYFKGKLPKAFYQNAVHDNIYDYDTDFEDVVGQESAIRAVEVAASGNHNIIMIGPPGSGKTMIAQRIPTILPKLSYEEALEVTKIYSVSDNLTNDFIWKRPFRSPHHTTTRAAFIGGGPALIPGEISLAHNGVLFLDEILEFKKSVLEVLRQPLEDRVIKISRGTGSVNYPANFMLVAATNPCPCGYFGSQMRECVCSEYERKRYINRLSGPFMDRIDLSIFVNSIPYNDLKKRRGTKSSKSIRKEVEAARNIQKYRYRNEKIFCNAQMNQRLILKYCKLNIECENMIEKIYDSLHLSTRAYSRILKVSRTIADLDSRANIDKADIIEALQYRKFLNNKVI